MLPLQNYFLQQVQYIRKATTNLNFLTTEARSCPAQQSQDTVYAKFAHSTLEISSYQTALNISSNIMLKLVLTCGKTLKILAQHIACIFQRCKHSACWLGDHSKANTPSSRGFLYLKVYNQRDLGDNN